MSDYKKSPLASMTTGMSEEERKEFVDSWRNATWLTDPLRKSLETTRKELLTNLIHTGSSNISDEELKAEIRSIDIFLRMIP